MCSKRSVNVFLTVSHIRYFRVSISLVNRLTCPVTSSNPLLIKNLKWTDLPDPPAPIRQTSWPDATEPDICCSGSSFSCCSLSSQELCFRNRLSECTLLQAPLMNKCGARKSICDVWAFVLPGCVSSRQLCRIAQLSRKNMSRLLPTLNTCHTFHTQVEGFQSTNLQEEN